MANLFDPFQIRGVTLRNRVGVSPMCQYSCVDGFATDWHLVHLGSRAVGGAGVVIVEATAVEARGRISPADMGLWKDEHIEPLARIARFIASQGAVPGIQLAHAGRKASTAVSWEGGKSLDDAHGGWQSIGADSQAFGDYRAPRPMTLDDIATVKKSFVASAKRAIVAGFRFIELHSAHGYLLHSFLSPISNLRNDEYGGSLENRTRFTVETAHELRRTLGDDLPLSVRISCTDWTDGGWEIEQSIELAKKLKEQGVDLIDCSSGGNVPHAKIPIGPGYQVPFATAIRERAGIATAAVGMITEPAQADDIIQSGKADIVLLAREMLRDPYWAIHAAKTLGQSAAMQVPKQYGRAF